MKRSRCSACFDQACVSGGRVERDDCPMNIHPEVFNRAKEIYANDPESAKIARGASMIEAQGYIRWPRLRDIIGLCERMGTFRVALIFCPDLWKEAKKTKRIFAEKGFRVLSRVCRVGADDEAQGRKELEAFAEECGNLGDYLIINAGLCVEAESVLTKRVDSPVITFLARDSFLHNYPALGIYASDEWRDWAKDVYAKMKDRR